jgi:FG-GAP-like repeat
MRIRTLLSIAALAASACSSSSSPSTAVPTPTPGADGGGDGAPPPGSVGDAGADANDGTAPEASGGGDGGGDGGKVGSTCAPAKVQLSPAVRITPAATPQVYAVADINHDGKSDILVAEATGIELLLSKGDGTFTSTVFAAPKYSSKAVLPADFDGDGLVDLVYETAPGPSLGFSHGNGDGTFGASTTIAIASDSRYVYDSVAADLNADGKLDVVIDTPNLNAGAFLLNTGGGTFAPPGTLGLNTDFTWSLADLNGTHAASLVSPDPQQGACVSLNNGSGAFAKAVCYATNSGTGADQSAVADLNGDGKLDVVTVCTANGNCGNSASNNASAFLGKGDGTLGAAIPSTAQFVESFTLADLDNDHKPDLVVSQSSSQLTVYAGKGDGTFAAAGVVYPATINNSDAILVGDFLGNGLLGLVVKDHNAGVLQVITATCKP